MLHLPPRLELVYLASVSMGSMGSLDVWWTRRRDAAGRRPRSLFAFAFVVDGVSVTVATGAFAASFDFDGGALALGLGESGVEGVHGAEGGVDAPGETREARVDVVDGGAGRRGGARATDVVVRPSGRIGFAVVVGTRGRIGAAGRTRGAARRARGRLRARPERRVRHHPARPSPAKRHLSETRATTSGVAHQS